MAKLKAREREIKAARSAKKAAVVVSDFNEDARGMMGDKSFARAMARLDELRLMDGVRQAPRRQAKKP